MRLLLLVSILATFAPPARAPLQIDVYTADDVGLNVNSTIIYGATEAIVVDAQFFNHDAAAVADRIAQTHRRLKAIIITHPHPDHFDGIALLLQRFPGTPVYMGAKGIESFKSIIGENLPQLQARFKAEAPDSVPAPQVPPSNHLTIDGQAVELTTDVQGDCEGPFNTYVWVPSLRTVITGDIVFDHVHVWLASSNPQNRAAWQATLRQISDLHPRVVIAGHQARPGIPTNADAIAFTSRYITDFEASLAGSTNAAALTAAMKAKYPDVADERILTRAAKTAFPQ